MIVLLLLLIFFVLIIYLFFKLTIGVSRSQSCLIGKTAIVTGASNGIGFEVALNLASRGCRVIIADINDIELAKKRIIVKTNNNNVVAKFLDLASLKSVRKFVGEILKTEQRLDILINNGGIGASVKEYTEDGLHPIMQINCFSHFLLTHLLIGLLKKSGPSRIIFTSGCFAYLHNLVLGNVNFPLDYPNTIISNSIIYANACVCNILISDGFALRLKGTKVTCNSLHPGAVQTGIYHQIFSTIHTNKLLVWIWNAWMKLCGKNCWEGAQTSIHLAVAQELEQVTGLHFWDCRVFWKPRIANDREFIDKLWHKLGELVQLSFKEKMLCV